jgi:Glycosyl hydrolase catalytic core
MDRRTFLTAVLAAPAAAGAGFAAAGPVPAPVTPSITRAAISSPRALKGAAHGGDDALALRQIRSLNPSWYYSWGSAYTVTTSPAFIPMVWSANALLQKDALGDVYRQLPATRTRHLLAFNEPDHAGQSNMSVDEAIRLWPHLQSTGLRLGSPATVGVTSPWLEQFMARARQANLRVDFMTMHSYASPNPESFLAKVWYLHLRYGRPVWVTEFAVADWSATPARPSRYTTREVGDFMQAAVAGMRVMPFVERFAWKSREPTDPAMGPSALYKTNGQLTSIGRLYASL